MIKNQKKPVEQIELTEEQKELLKPAIILVFKKDLFSFREYFIEHKELIKVVLEEKYCNSLENFKNEVKKELEMNAE